MKKKRLIIFEMALIFVCLGILLCKTGVISLGIFRDNGSSLSVEQGDNKSDENGGKDANGSEPLAVILLASDYQSEDGFADPADTLRSVIRAAEADGKVIDSAIFCGDYTNVDGMYNHQLKPDKSIAEIKSVLTDECPEIMPEDAEQSDETASAKAADMSDAVVFVQGNHDAWSKVLTSSGLHDFGAYYVYVINTENDYPWSQGTTPGRLDKVRRTAADLDKTLGELADRSGDSTRTGNTANTQPRKPVIIAGHVPLHYSARTSSNHTTGDNLYASLIFDAVNKYGSEMSIIYLFGHNHSKGWDCFLGGSCVYKAPGDTIIVPDYDASSVTTDSFSERELTFTYMNAGYVGYYMNCAPAEFKTDADRYKAADMTLTASVCEIFPAKIVITRYDSEGLHNLGSAGSANPYRNYIDRDLIPEKYYSNAVPSPAVMLRHLK